MRRRTWLCYTRYTMSMQCNNSSSCCATFTSLDTDVTTLARLLRADTSLVFVLGTTYSNLTTLYWSMPRVVQRAWYPLLPTSPQQQQRQSLQQSYHVRLLPHAPMQLLCRLPHRQACPLAHLNVLATGDAIIRHRRTAATRKRTTALTMATMLSLHDDTQPQVTCVHDDHAATTDIATTTAADDDESEPHDKTVDESAAPRACDGDTASLTTATRLRHVVAQFVTSDADVTTMLRKCTSRLKRVRGGGTVRMAYQLVLFVNTDVASASLLQQMQIAHDTLNDGAVVATTMTTTTTATRTTMSTLTAASDTMYTQATRVCGLLFASPLLAQVQRFVCFHGLRSHCHDTPHTEQPAQQQQQHRSSPPPPPLPPLSSCVCAGLCLAANMCAGRSEPHRDRELVHAVCNGDTAAAVTAALTVRVTTGGCATRTRARSRRATRPPPLPSMWLWLLSQRTRRVHVWPYTTCPMMALPWSWSCAAAAAAVAQEQGDVADGGDDNKQDASSSDRGATDVRWVCADEQAITALRSRALEHNCDMAAVLRNDAVSVRCGVWSAAKQTTTMTTTPAVTHGSYYDTVAFVGRTLTRAACLTDVFVLEYVARTHACEVSGDDDGRSDVDVYSNSHGSSSHIDDDKQAAVVAAAKASVRKATHRYALFRDSIARERLLRSVQHLTRATAPSRLTLTWVVDDARELHTARFAFCMSYEHYNMRWPTRQARRQYTFPRDDDDDDDDDGVTGGGGRDTVTVDASTMQWQLRYTLRVLRLFGWRLVYQYDHRAACSSSSCSSSCSSSSTSTPSAAVTSGQANDGSGTCNVPVFTTTASRLRQRVRVLLDAYAAASTSSHKSDKSSNKDDKQQQQPQPQLQQQQQSMPECASSSSRTSASSCHALWQAALVSASSGVHLRIGMYVYVDVSHETSAHAHTRPHVAVAAADEEQQQQQQQQRGRPQMQYGVIVGFLPPPSPLPPHTCSVFARWWRQQQRHRGDGDGAPRSVRAWRPWLPSYVDVAAQQTHWPVVRLVSSGRCVHVLPRLSRCTCVRYPPYCFVSAAQQEQQQQQQQQQQSHAKAMTTTACNASRTRGSGGDDDGGATAVVAPPSSSSSRYTNVCWSLLCGDEAVNMADKRVVLLALPLQLVQCETAASLYTTMVLTQPLRRSCRNTVCNRVSKMHDTAARGMRACRQWMRVHVCDHNNNNNDDDSDDDDGDSKDDDDSSSSSNTATTRATMHTSTAQPCLPSSRSCVRRCAVAHTFRECPRALYCVLHCLRVLNDDDKGTRDTTDT